MPLQTLLLSGYDLTILPETFGHTMSVLERLHLNDNQLTQLPDGFGTGRAARRASRQSSAMACVATQGRTEPQ